MLFSRPCNTIHDRVWILVTAALRSAATAKRAPHEASENRQNSAARETFGAIAVSFVCPSEDLSGSHLRNGFAPAGNVPARR
jgi:hypothetical protein